MKNKKSFWKTWKIEKLLFICDKYLEYHVLFGWKYDDDRCKFNHLYTSMIASISSVLENTPIYTIEALDYKMQSDFEFMDYVIEKYEIGEYEE